MKALAIASLLAAGQAAAASTQPVQEIRDSVTQFVGAALEPGGRYEVVVAQIDPRLQLPMCAQPLQAFAQSGEIKPGRNTVGVRCQAEKGWTVYSVAMVKAFKQVAILNKSLRRNDVIRAEYLNFEIRDAGMMQAGYVTDASQVVDKQAVRNIPAGSVLNRQHYAEPTLVRRGERVNIQSGKFGMLITAMGTALNDGTEGQRISVKNLSSQRVIQAVVVGSGQVTVNF